MASAGDPRARRISESQHRRYLRRSCRLRSRAPGPVIALVSVGRTDSGLVHCYLTLGRWWGRMPAMLQAIDSIFVIVLHNGKQEIERELEPLADALWARAHDAGVPRRLESGAVLKLFAAKLDGGSHGLIKNRYR
jgi:hypothetical protein